MICIIQVAQIKVSVQYGKADMLLFVKTYQRRKKKNYKGSTVRREIENAIKNQQMEYPVFDPLQLCYSHCTKIPWLCPENFPAQGSHWCSGEEERWVPVLGLWSWFPPIPKAELESVDSQLQQQIWHIPLKSSCVSQYLEGPSWFPQTGSAQGSWGKGMSAAFPLLYI